ncbi:hypothetical protein RSOL_112600 [Rhizoctonia solani AG-3 Rhs1AP]|uniref:Uncharacterized protein n=2 Tax=Rhizoctonia solani AG-3 TaxID=1086053 RepID=A0A074RUN5_9AGAM|nr:hypothetical protein RSOL_112600 [Rhizoctonia solani AG-3 Rhs1AP]KEP48343.1 hypothetical protein V565_127000 [Rhizoctonia solani 123E]
MGSYNRVDPHSERARPNPRGHKVRWVDPWWEGTRVDWAIGQEGLTMMMKTMSRLQFLQNPSPRRRKRLLLSPSPRRKTPSQSLLARWMRRRSQNQNPKPSLGPKGARPRPKQLPSLNPRQKTRKRLRHRHQRPRLKPRRRLRLGRGKREGRKWSRTQSSRQPLRWRWNLGWTSTRLPNPSLPLKRRVQKRRLPLPKRRHGGRRQKPKPGMTPNRKQSLNWKMFTCSPSLKPNFQQQAPLVRHLASLLESRKILLARVRVRTRMPNRVPDCPSRRV